MVKNGQKWPEMVKNDQWLLLIFSFERTGSSFKRPGLADEPVRLKN